MVTFFKSGGISQGESALTMIAWVVTAARLLITLTALPLSWVRRICPHSQAR